MHHLFDLFRTDARVSCRCGVWLPLLTAACLFFLAGPSSGLGAAANLISGLHATANMISGPHATANLISGLHATANIASGVYGHPARVDIQAEPVAEPAAELQIFGFALDGIDTDAILETAVESALQAQAAARLLEAGLQLAPVLSDLLGFEGPRTYLLLVQNNHELRATGGFISGIGLVTIEEGRIGEIELTDSYRIMNNRVAHPPAPPAMQVYMGIELLLVRDANWSPDFPTTAALLQALYTENTGRAVDGIVAIDLYATQLLVDALGPLQVEEAETLVTGENFIEQVIQFWETPDEGVTLEEVGLGAWWQQRKNFMPAVAEAAATKLRAGKFNPLALAQALVTALDQGSIQVWLPHTGAFPESAHALDTLGWSGRIASAPGVDYLAVVDTNVGYNKVDAILTRSLDYAVSWQGEQPIATLTLTYQHPTPVADHVCDPQPRYGANYADMTLRCYFNFVRVYVPRGSELIAVTGLETDSINLEARRGPNSTDVFSGYFVMEPGVQHQVRFHYALPQTIQPDGYRLLLRRQAGIDPLPLRLTVNEHTLDTVLAQTFLNWTPETKIGNQ